QPVNQARICIEVLRKYLGASTPLGLSQAELRYRESAYNALLNRIGTSNEELRLARGADPETRGALAAKLGIDPDERAPGQIDQLLLEPQETPEAKLEELFGLADTRRDPSLSMPDPRLLKWQLDHLGTIWTVA